MRFASPRHSRDLRRFTALVVHLTNEQSEARALFYGRRGHGERRGYRWLRPAGMVEVDPHLAVIVRDTARHRYARGALLSKF